MRMYPLMQYYKVTTNPNRYIAISQQKIIWFWWN